MSDQNPPSWGDQPPPPPGGQPPSNQPGGWDQPPPPPPPPGDSGYGYGAPEAYAAAPTAGLGYASWGQRVGAYLVDVLVMIPAYIVIFIGIGIGASGATTDPVTGEVSGGNAAGFVVAGIGYLLIFAILIWNTIIRQGRTGWSIGKQALGIRLLREEDGQPMGAGMNFVRQIVHIVDGIPCYIGYLWPLWDAKRQTFADKIMKTVVVQQKKA